MHYRLLMRCAVASAGALAFFTAALATPSPSRYGIHGQARDACGAAHPGQRVPPVSAFAGHALRACIVKAAVR